MKISVVKVLGIICFAILPIVIIYLSSSEIMKIDETTCKELDSEKEQGSCFFDIAKIQNNQELCRKIKENSTKADCYYYFAIKNENVELCDKVRENKKECYDKLLEKNVTEELCKDIDYDYREKCYRFLAYKEKDLNFCDVTYSKRKECYEDIIRKYPGEDLCENIRNDFYKKDCYYYLATVHKIVSYCDKASNATACCKEVVGDKIDKEKEEKLKNTIKREEKEINGVKMIVGSGMVTDRGGRFDIGTGNLYYSVRNAVQGKGYFYTGNFSNVSPYLAIGNMTSHPLCSSDYGGYEGISNFCEFTSIENYSFKTDPNGRSIEFGDKDSCCNQGILIFKQGNLYGAIDFIYINENGDLYYDYYYDTTGGANFNLLCDRQAQ